MRRVLIAGAEFSRRLAVVMRVALTIHGRNAVRGALVVDGVCALVAELARCALLTLLGAELRGEAALRVGIAWRTVGRDAVRRAEAVHRILLGVAEVAGNAFVFTPFDC